MHVGFFDAENNLPGDSDPVEHVVDETHIVDEGVDVTRAEHQQRGDQLGNKKSQLCICFHTPSGQMAARRLVRLTVNIKAGMGVQRVT